MSNYDDDYDDNNNRGAGCVTWLIIFLLIWGFLATAGGGLELNINLDSSGYTNSGHTQQRVYTNYPTAVHPDGWYSNPANFEHRQPTPTPALLSGVHYDQFGQRVEIHPGNVTMRQRDANGGEFLEINGVRYFRTATGELFRTGQ